MAAHVEAQCDRLRSLVHDALAKHLTESAAFFADKLVTLSGGAPADMFLLAQAYFLSRQHRRCLQLLQTGEPLLTDLDVRFRLLAARCMAECGDWEDLLALLSNPSGGPNVEDLAPAELEEGDEPRGAAISFGAAMCCLRGRAFEAMDNRARAAACYSAALRADPFCYEAFVALIEQNMLGVEEERALLSAMRIPPEDSWLRLLYEAKGKPYGVEDQLEVGLQKLEAPLTPAASQPERSGGDSGAAGSHQTPMQTSAVKGVRPSGEDSDSAVSSHMAADSSFSFQHPPDAGGGSSSPAGVTQQSQQQQRQQQPLTVPGCGLGGNADVAIAKASLLYHRGIHQGAYDITGAVLASDPYAAAALPVHLAAAVELRRTSDLFLLGHRLMEERPGEPISWYAAGCYYMACSQFDAARRYFGRATAADPNFAPAWLAYGDAFSAQDESDQAMAAYRTAARQFPGLAAPLLGLGTEYARLNNLPLAEHMLTAAARLCPEDPLIAHEQGCVALRVGDPIAAEAHLNNALRLAKGGMSSAWEPTWLALGHALRRCRRYDEAAAALQTALRLVPGSGATRTALGYTRHLQGRTLEAIEEYHKALALRPEDTFAAEMLTNALRESCPYDDDIAMP